MGLADVQSKAGVLAGRAVSNDPAFFGPPMQARASEFNAVRIRLRLEKTSGSAFTDSAQLFWRTSRLAESEATSEHFAVTGDGQWHDYTVVVAKNRRWRGVITRLRIDPCNRPGVRVEIGSVKLVRQ